MLSVRNERDASRVYLTPRTYQMSELSFFFVTGTATTEIYTVSDTLSLHDALPISARAPGPRASSRRRRSRPCPSSPRRSEEHTSELQSPDTISYAVFCLQQKK